ncbi:MAG: quinone-dependent dihydroorotate dehydrogenase [Xanthomonadales bacterium]|jgi:dihydroorotate dehydrogenase|nr:quinone-dependent dihydroorotate dehydrogenase [Xanthomonadales bacterium]
MYSLARPLLFALDPERAHELGLKAIEAAYRTGLNPLLGLKPKPLPVDVAGLRFENPVGLAAGLDKNAAHIDALASLGFGFIEVGTVTPRPQSGNPKPRMFRLPEYLAVINRLGFNNAGLEVFCRNLERRRWRGVLGVNLGRNKDTPNEDALEDYRRGLEQSWAQASYLTINISSPNTEGLRALQAAEPLKRLLGELREAADRAAVRHGVQRPLFVKIAPDLGAAELDAIALAVEVSGFNGVICTNTTLDRSVVATHRHGAEAGGLSGAPVFGKSTEILGGLRQRLPGIALIGVGGICAGADAAAKIAAGADLVQFYTGFIYRGPALIAESVEAIRAYGTRPRE